MNIFWAAFLGILQGLTEFLPISSSGHLVLVQSFIPGFSQPGVLLDVVLHLGTLFSIIYYYRRRIVKLKLNYIYLIIIGTIPVVLIGFLFQDYIEMFFGSVKLVGIALIVTGIINLLTDRAVSRSVKVKYKESILIGFAQALALIPGISRSGSTISAGSNLGIDKRKAAEFSFLLSIPAILGASVLQIASYGSDGLGNMTYYIAGFFAAFITGVFAINLVLRSLKARNFKYFAVYCFIVGGIALLIS